MLSTAELFRDGKRVDIDLKRGTRLKKGDRVVISTSGGAGYGDPKLRSRESVREDIAQGVISAETAGRVYGLGTERRAE